MNTFSRPLKLFLSKKKNKDGGVLSRVGGGAKIVLLKKGWSCPHPLESTTGKEKMIRDT